MKMPADGLPRAKVKTNTNHNKAYVEIERDGVRRTAAVRHAMEIRVLNDLAKEVAFIELRRQSDTTLTLAVYTRGEDEAPEFEVVLHRPRRK